MNITVNGQHHSDIAVRTVAELVAMLGLSNKRIAVERNGEIVPRSAHAATTLTEGDRFEIVVAVGGG